MSDIAPAQVESQASDFDSSALMAAVSLHNDQASGQAQPQKAPEAPAKSETQAPAKSETQAPAKSETQAPRKPWETKVEEHNLEEPEAKLEPEIEEPPVPMEPKAKIRWGELRKTEEAYKLAMPELEALRKEVATLKATPSKIPPELEQELTELRQLRAAHAIETTPEWREGVETPWDTHTQRLQDVAAVAKVDVNQLIKLIDEPNRLLRGRQVREILGKSTEELGETDVMEAISALNDLIPVDAKARELKKNALDIQNGLQGREKAQSEQTRLANEQRLTQAADEMYGHFQNTFAAVKLFDNKELADVVKGARPANVQEAPMDAAYQAMAGAVLPEVLNMVNALRKEVAEKTKVLSARSRTTTQTNGAPVISSEQKETPWEEDLSSAIRMHAAHA